MVYLPTKYGRALMNSPRSVERPRERGWRRDWIRIQIVGFCIIIICPYCTMECIRPSQSLSSVSDLVPPSGFASGQMYGVKFLLPGCFRPSLLLAFVKRGKLENAEKILGARARIDNKLNALMSPGPDLSLATMEGSNLRADVYNVLCFAGFVGTLCHDGHLKRRK